jgi:hypothetical protein
VAATDENIFFKEKGIGKSANILADLIDFQDLPLKSNKSRQNGKGGVHSM